MSVAILVIALAVLAWLLTALLRRYALARSLMDVPNARSSHSVPTPRGGGVAIVVAFLGGLTLAFLLGLGIAPSLYWALLGAGVGIALLGFLDDHGHIAARWRLLGHFAAAVWALYWLGGLPPLAVFGGQLDLGWLGHVLAAFYLVWLLNLYNFMDGIDGIASVEAICVSLGGVLVYLLVASWQAPGLGGWLVPLLLAVAVAGFLVWNFPPARIFMGDAGSGFIGIVLGVLSIQASATQQALLWCWLILLGVFVVDATLTLLRRLLRGEKVYEAHRSHAYQFAAREHGRHLPVTLAVLAVNLLWLIPVAVAVALGWLDGALGLLIAYIPLLLLAIKYRAGEAE
ncbi:MAG: glycosyltransferase family 4 protein [Gammaproteobacteria bacterium]|nr:glycosyltransferase family 4 protein [Gammaproteobacteria bacterium]MBU2158112.1 glycosyltransferase family 4 protein [Gammaproteobacteria bacterium]MBU2255746.1 glycosyltransferase family 4 protein [Gammaproteobacteria bacterium]MBU2295356.1 glycosyltransferase family 4 protein [Gammaproteobacteria bacterium]